MSNESARQVAIEAKYLRPRFDEVSLRPVASQALRTAFEHRLTVVCAPAGYGKTTTTAAALERCGRTSSWYKLDVLDHDPLVFLAAMTRAVQRVHGAFGEALLQTLEAGPVSDVPVQVLAAQFCSQCDRFVTSDLHLVLDDYHEAMDSVALNAVLDYLFENCPSPVHFVVLSRYEPAFRLEKLRLAGAVARVPRDLFLFDPDQVADILAQRSGRRHDPETIQRLHRLTEGWPASVVLAGMALSWLDVSSLEGALGDPRLRTDVFSYLAEQVFQRQSEDVRRFLLGTCCLEHVTAGLAKWLTGSDRASRHLHFLAHNHIFTFDTERAGAYRYHNLLRDFLRQRFVHEEGEEAFRDLQRRTAVALEEAGDLPGAIELLLGANELDLALGVIARGGEVELERRPSEQLRIWSSRLSAYAEADEPWALVLLGVLATRESRFATSLDHLRRAFGIFQARRDSSSMYQSLSILEWAEYWSGDSAACMKTCLQALKYASTDIQRLHTLLSLQSAALDMRRWSDADEAAQRASELLPRASESEATRAQALQAHAAYYRGDMRNARGLMPDDGGLRQAGAQLAASLNTRGMIHLALGNYEEAQRELDSAAEVAVSFGQVLTSHMIEDNIALLDASLGRFDSAESRLSQLMARSDELDQTVLCFVLTHMGTVLRRRGDVKESLEPSALAADAVPLERDPYLALNSAANLTFAHGLQGLETTSKLLVLSSTAAEHGIQFVELKALLYAAILEAEAGCADSALDLLHSCLPRQMALGHINLLTQELNTRPGIVALLLNKGLGESSLAVPLLSALSAGSHFPTMAAAILGQAPPKASSWIRRLLDTRSESHSLPAGDIPSASLDVAQPPLRDLTAREMAVLHLMASNRSNAQIGAELYIAMSTVKTHINHILRKLGQSTRVGAILEYQRLIAASPPGLRREINPGYDSASAPQD